jgi:hypothetical protein
MLLFVERVQAPFPCYITEGKVIVRDDGKTTRHEQ